MVEQLLSPFEREHSERLVARIREEIDRSGGWISFGRYMELALYEPGLGYYSAGAAKFGVAGDFVTAPELSPLFSRCLANQCADVLKALKGGDILELGAGSGVMAADLLNELEALDALPARYLILEVSAELKQRQRATLETRAARHLRRVEWLDALPTSSRRPSKSRRKAASLPAIAAILPIKGVILANEVMDAIPVDRFRIRSAEVHALGVTWQSGKLDWSEVRVRGELNRRVRAIEKELGVSFPEGYTSEINLRIPAWVHGLGDALKKGAILLMDYGLPRRQYYGPERHDGTLLCHFRHQFNNDPFRCVGLQDIGAWVDFTTVAESAVDAGLKLAGFTTQAHFLMGSGIERYLTEQAGELKERINLARQAMLLTLPGEMGERFKVIGLTRRLGVELKGFLVRDLAASL